MRVARAADVALVGALAWEVPVLRDALHEHLDENDGEVLPHLLMADYERWAETAVATDDPRLARLLALLEGAYGSGGAQAQELISVSFLEHLPRPGEPGSELRHMVGPRMAEQLRVIG